MEQKYIIYALVQPDTNEIRYIGKSTSGLSRPKEHFKPKNYLHGKTYKDKWMNKCLSNNIIPEIIILASTENKEELCNLEIEYIEKYKQMGAPLTNLTDGGEGSLGWVPSEETRKNISEGRKRYLAALTEPIIAYNRNIHVFIDGIEHKECSFCQETKLLNEFGTSKASWDNLNRNCKRCCAAKMAKRREQTPPKKLTPEEFKQSYVDRKEAVRNGVKRAYLNNPNLKNEIKKRNSKAIEGICVYTGVKITFASALEAKKSGFQNSNIGQAIRKGVPYKGYMWRFI